jgi:hypothetical protein
MLTYKLYRYSLGEDEELVFEHSDADVVVQEALTLSAKDVPYTYAYRMEAWQDGKMIGGWRFFQDGEEFTESIKRAIIRNK